MKREGQVVGPSRYEVDSVILHGIFARISCVWS